MEQDLLLGDDFFEVLWYMYTYVIFCVPKNAIQVLVKNSCVNDAVNFLNPEVFRERRRHVTVCYQLTRRVSFLKLMYLPLKYNHSTFSIEKVLNVMHFKSFFSIQL